MYDIFIKYDGIFWIFYCLMDIRYGQIDLR